MPWPSKLFIPLIIAATATVTAAPVASAQQPPDDQRSITAGPRGSEPIELTWLSAGVVPARGGAGPATSSAAVVGRQPSPNLGAAAAPGRDATPIPFDDLISNYGCMMVEAEPGEHLGVNCIDEGWLNTDGTVYVHTTVPAAQQVRFSSEPAHRHRRRRHAGVRIAFDLDSAPDYSSYEFTSKPFDILPAHTYYILAMAWDSEGNMAWRYGTATVPHTAARRDRQDHRPQRRRRVLRGTRARSSSGSASTTSCSGRSRRRSTTTATRSIPTPTTSSRTRPNWSRSGRLGERGRSRQVCRRAIHGLRQTIRTAAGCHFAQAVETFDLTTPPPSLDFDFTSPDEHLRIRVEGHITLSIG